MHIRETMVNYAIVRKGAALSPEAYRTILEFNRLSGNEFRKKFNISKACWIQKMLLYGDPYEKKS